MSIQTGSMGPEFNKLSESIQKEAAMRVFIAMVMRLIGDVKMEMGEKRKEFPETFKAVSTLNQKYQLNSC